MGYQRCLNRGEVSRLLFGQDQTPECTGLSEWPQPFCSDCTKAISTTATETLQAVHDFLTVVERDPALSTHLEFATQLWQGELFSYLQVHALLVGLTPQWRPRNKAARLALEARARAEAAAEDDLTWQLLLEGMYLALGDATSAQRIRFGASWWKDEQGRPILLEPWWLLEAQERIAGAADLFWSWWRQRTIREMLSGLLEQWSSSGVRFTSLEVGDQADESSDPLEALVAQENSQEAMSDLAMHLQYATPTQVVLILSKLADEERNFAEIARSLGMAPSTARVQMHLFRKRVEGSADAP